MASGSDGRIRLHLLRHADAGDSEAWSGPDAERPLSPKGRDQADRLGRFLAATGFRADLLVTSPKVRARETAAIVAEHLGLTVRVDDALADGPTLDEVEQILVEADGPARPVLVGHDPAFSDLAAALAGAPGLSLKKGCLVRLDATLPFAPGDAALRWIVPPDLLDGWR